MPFNRYRRCISCPIKDFNFGLDAQLAIMKPSFSRLGMVIEMALCCQFMVPQS